METQPGVAFLALAQNHPVAVQGPVLSFCFTKLKKNFKNRFLSRKSVEGSWSAGQRKGWSLAWDDPVGHILEQWRGRQQRTVGDAAQLSALSVLNR